MPLGALLAAVPLLPLRGNLRGELLQSRDFRNHDRIGVGERVGQFGLKNVSTRRIAARLEDGPNFLVWVFQPQRFQRLANRRWVMAKVVHHGHAAHDAAHFHAALDAFERVERGLNLLVG